MRVLIDLSSFSAVHCGGKDEVAYNLLRGFSELGHSEELVCVCSSELNEIVKKINPSFHIINIERKIGASKFELIAMHFKDFRYGQELKKIIKEEDIDIVLYTNKPIPAIRLKVKTILLPHDVQSLKIVKERWYSIYHHITSKLIKDSFKVSDKVIAISEFDKEEMIKYLPQYEDKIVRIYDPIRFSDMIKQNKSEYITAINIQWSHKNVVTLIKAFAQIADKVEYDLMLVGRKNFLPGLEDEINKIIKENNISNRINFTGFVEEKKLNDIISKTRIYVNPSLFEGFGMTAVEMMGMGIPTIVAKNTAQPEATLGLCGYYEPSTDEKSLADAIMKELNDPTSEELLSEISDSVRSEYNYLNIARQYWTFFEDNLQKKHLGIH